MGKFLELMKATEADWDAETSADLPEGSYIFELKQSKRQDDKDSLVIYFAAKRPQHGNASDFRADKYRPIPVLFNERNTWLFVKFVKDSGLTLNKIEAQLPKLVGKLYTGTVKHNLGREPNADGTPKKFVNLNDLVPYNANAVTSNLAPVEDDESVD